MTVDELKESFSLTDGEIAEARATLQLQRLAEYAPIPDEVREKVRDPRKFSVSSVVERLMKPPTCRGILKIEFTPEDGLTYKGGDDEFMDAYGLILTAAVEEEDGKVGTRRFNKVADAEKFLKGLNYSPKGQVKKGADLLEMKTTASEPSPSSAAATKKTSKKKTAKKRVSERALFEPPLGGHLLVNKTLAVVEQIEKLRPVKDYDLVIGVMLRVLLEIALVTALRSTKDYDTLCKDPNVRPDIGPTLSQMLEFVRDGHSCLSPNPADKREMTELKRVMGKKQEMNAYIHSNTFPADEKKVREIAATLGPVLQLLLNAKRPS